MPPFSFVRTKRRTPARGGKFPAVPDVGNRGNAGGMLHFPHRGKRGSPGASARQKKAVAFPGARGMYRAEMRIGQ